MKGVLGAATLLFERVFYLFIFCLVEIRSSKPLKSKTDFGITSGQRISIIFNYKTNIELTEGLTVIRIYYKFLIIMININIHLKFCISFIRKKICIKCLKPR